MNEMSIADIDETIKALKALKRKQRTPRPRTTTTTQKVVKHQRKLTCTNCGQIDTRANLIRISKYEYEHALCPPKQITTVRIDFTL